jgi:hypothetical protein
LFYWGYRTPKFPGTIIIQPNTAALRVPLGGSPTIDAKNAVLAKIASDFVFPPTPQNPFPTKFDRLDYFVSQPGYERASDYWRRDWNGGGLAKLLLPEVYSYPKSYLRMSGCGVSAKLRIRSVAFELSLIAYRGRVTKTAPMTVWPHARVRIRAECVVTASESLVHPSGGVCEETISNSGGGHYPAVTPGAEDIVFVDGMDRISDPPTMVEWWGMLGTFSSPRNSAVLSHSGSYLNKDQGCPELLRSLRGLFVPAWPYMSQSGGGSPYIGGVVLSFPGY